MALTNFLITLMGVGAVAYLMKRDVRDGSAMLRRNLRHIRSWLEEQSAAAEQTAKQDIKQVTERKLPTEHKPPDAGAPPQQ